MIDTKALRNKILDAAIRGKLTEQLPEDSNAEDLYNQIQEEKQKLIKEGKIKKEKSLPPITDDKIPFEIPENWKWVRLQNVCRKIVDGDHNPPTGEIVKTEYLLLSSLNISNDKLVNLDKCRYLSKEMFEIENQRTAIEVGDIFLTTVATLGRSCIFEGGLNISFQRSVSVITSLIDNHFLKLVFDSPYFQNLMAIAASGTAQKGFYLNQLAATIIPLPPIAEQKRIVKFIESLFSQLGIIDELQSKLSGNSIALRTKLIEFGIQGKLTIQLPEDGNAEDLYNQIQEEKQKLIKEGKIKKDKSESYIFRRDNSHYEKFRDFERCIDDEISFKIPSNWKWVRLGNIWQVINGDRGKNYPAKSSLKTTGIPFISALNLNGKNVIADDRLMCLSEKQYDKLGNGKLEKNDIVVCIRGSLGKHGIFQFEKGAIASSLVILRAEKKYSSDLLSLLMTYLDSSLFFQEVDKYDNGSAQPNIAAKNLERFLVPLPPIAEQRRIAEKLNQLLLICGELCS